MVYPFFSSSLLHAIIEVNIVSELPIKELLSLWIVVGSVSSFVEVCAPFSVAVLVHEYPGQSQSQRALEPHVLHRASSLPVHPVYFRECNSEYTCTFRALQLKLIYTTDRRPQAIGSSQWRGPRYLSTPELQFL